LPSKFIDNPVAGLVMPHPGLLPRLPNGCKLSVIVTNMKLIKTSVVSFALLAIAGCTLAYHRSTITGGFDFPGGNVSMIVKGKTTGDEIIQMFGGPLSKNDILENEEQWRYSYSTGIEIRESGFLTDEEHSTHWHKTLVILFKNGIVTDFTYTEGH
jgi:outer membrane protein assembly factor BamE (lipoprotein component of BamABCDE complex)